MKYKISNVYINVNGEDIAVGVVLGEEDHQNYGQHIRDCLEQVGIVTG